MVLFERKEQSTRAGESLPGTNFSIPTGTITLLSIIYLIIQTLSSAIGTSITKSVNNEVENQHFVLKEQNFKLQMLQRILELQDPNDRKTSLKLLIHTGLIKDNNKVLENFVDNNSIPKWNKQNIETLSTYLSSSSLGSSTQLPPTVLIGTDSSGNLSTVRGKIPVD